ncbi:acetolactate synthase-1/2/3 large subunit [Roseovarius halotolerans]|uniref:Acetolactate synthase large subunit IlvG n=1 Tax=Roseovarius halotolerans TaxID=505353 RepID=A0A1X6Y942_9RHOB|nr:thiamine pyrophosphate-binding protein [Roseovarius halotolerans]RKT35077.1 acetolactate synthase-1/2/3 large subunit [Roseovarius halotolerans]SLN14010.1 Acetolactate synthase large subunit IlvG [Roseovarius halotolerans]
MTETRGADILVRALAEAGTDTIFALSGNQIMPVFDACIDAGLRIVHTRHEAAAVFMAEAHAQLTGQVGVALVTAGGGIANTGGALFSASESETPVLLLSGDSPVAQDGRGAFQEMDQLGVTSALTRLSLRATRADALADNLARALDAAAGGRPGPVHMALPFDVLNDPVPDDGTATIARPARDVPAADDIAKVAAALTKAKRPLIILGPALNSTRAPGLAARLRAQTGAPVCAMESPRGLKDPALGHFGELIPDSDLIVTIGKRVDFTLGFGAGDMSWICVQADADEAARAALNLKDRLHLAVQACPRAFAEALADHAQDAPARDVWCASVDDLIEERLSGPPEDADGRITSAGLCMAVQAALAARAPAETVAICDGGEFGQWAQAILRPDARVINGPSGAIGGGLPYALGARAARPDAAIVAMMGDGTVGFHLPEFETAMRESLPFVVVIGNDRRWNAEHQIQLRNYGAERLIGCELSGARYDLAAAGLGAHGEYVTRPDDLPAALERAFAAGKPACVNVEIAGLPAPSGH